MWSMPWHSSHGLGLDPRQLNGLGSNLASKNERNLDSILLDRLICHTSDDFDDSEFSDPTYIYATRFCRRPGSEDLLALANEDGKVFVQDTAKSGSSSVLTFFEAHNNAIFDVAWVPGSQSQLVTVSGDQSAKLWDFSNVKTTSEVDVLRVFRGYTRSVKCVEFVPDDVNVFATGSRENAIFIWDLRCPSDTKAVNVIRNAHTVQSAGTATPKPAKRRRESLGRLSSPGPTCNSSVTAIQFQDVHTLISSSDHDGIIKVWDMRKSYDRFSRQPQPKYQFAYPGKSALKGYSALVLNPAKTQLFASCKDHTIYKFDVAAYNEKPIAMYTGFENNSKYFSRLSLSPDGRYLVSGSSDNFARIWNVGPLGPLEPIASLEGHEAEVTCVEWCSKDLRLITCADDMRHRTWRLVNDKTIIDKNQIVGEAKINPEVQYFIPPIYTSSLIHKPSTFNGDDKKLTLVKRRIFETGDENNRNVENLVASNRSSSSSSSLDPANSRSNFPCSPCKMNVTPRKRTLMTTATTGSPKKLYLSPRKFDSPTAHLPNLVLDEVTNSPATSSSAAKSASKARQRLDWLTTLSRQKKQLNEQISGSKKQSDQIQIQKPKMGAKRKL